MIPLYNVYSFSCPESSVIRYIGITKHPIDVRLKQHYYDVTANKKTHKVYWLRSLMNKNLKPIVNVIAKDISFEEAKALEILLISQYTEQGIKLVNGTKGGEGMLGYKHSPETIEKLAALRRGKKMKPHSQETKDKIREAALKNGIKPENMEKMQTARRLAIRKTPSIPKGYKWPQHIVDKRAKAQTGLKRTEETKQNISKAKKGKPLSEAHRLALKR